VARMVHRDGTMPRLPAPPWRSPAFATITAPAGYDDAHARTLLLRALVTADAAPTVEAMAKGLGVGERTLQRALRWLEAHDRAAFGLLRTRTHGGGAKAAAARWAKRAAAKAEKPGS
jgi:hypothetical protein